MTEVCPECKQEIKIIRVQDPIPSNNTGGAATTLTSSFTITGTCAEYPPTSKTYKCSNPECWVTKVRVSWE